MALLKIYSLPGNQKLIKENLGRTLKLISSAVLNCSEIPTCPDDIELVFGEAIDLSGIDFIIEIVACKRPDLQKRSMDLIKGLNTIYPNKLFSVYYNLIEEEGMANTPRSKKDNKTLSLDEAIALSRD